MRITFFSFSALSLTFTLAACGPDWELDADTTAVEHPSEPTIETDMPAELGASEERSTNERREPCRDSREDCDEAGRTAEPPLAAYYQFCSDDRACEAGLSCKEYEQTGAGFCTRACNRQAPCPNGASCVEGFCEARPRYDLSDDYLGYVSTVEDGEARFVPTAIALAQSEALIRGAGIQTLGRDRYRRLTIRGRVVGEVVLLRLDHSDGAQTFFAGQITPVRLDYFLRGQLGGALGEQSLTFRSTRPPN
jgi:hypothetical protein